MESQTKYSNVESGLLWGAILGDAIGAHVQNDKYITKEKIKNAFLILGGGIRNLQPGQVTDDSQLTLAVAKGLIAGKGILNLNLIALEMGNWFLSKPIDVGGTIRNSVPKACNMKQHQAHVVRKGARERSQESQSNGTLMAISALALWCSKLKISEIQIAVKQYTILIHPNEIVILTNTFYVIVIVSLLKNKKNLNRREQAFIEAKAWLVEKKNKILDEWIQIVQKTNSNFQLLLKQVNPEKASGWIKIAFCYALHFLISKVSFKDAIEKIISVKGDTDTNACIVGALLGSFYGIEEMQMNEQIQKISKIKNKSKRPDWLIPGRSLDAYIKRLKQIAPNELKLIGEQK